MQRLLFSTIIVALFSCNHPADNMHQQADSTGVVTLPSDSVDKNMPVHPTENSGGSNMPVIDPDTGKVQPK